MSPASTLTSCVSLTARSIPSGRAELGAREPVMGDGSVWLDYKREYACFKTHVMSRGYECKSRKMEVRIE